MAKPVWAGVRRDLGQQPIVEGRIDGPTPLFVERYLYQADERTVAGLDGTGLVTQFGGGQVREGEHDRWRSLNLPTQSLLVPRRVPTHWHYSGTVDFAVCYLLDGQQGVGARLVELAEARDAPLPFSDPLVGTLALHLVNELQKGSGADEGFMARAADLMCEQAYRALTLPVTGGINPRHVHFPRLQAALNHIHLNLKGDLSLPELARRAGVSVAYFRRMFEEASGVSPHRYVLAARLERARKLLTQSTWPIARIAEECGFSSQSHLTACFRSAHSVTPARYRSRLRQSGG